MATNEYRTGEVVNPALKLVATGFAPGTANLDVPKGQTIVLSPAAPQFHAHYRQIRPQTIDQVRELFWLLRPAPTGVKTHIAEAVAAIGRKPIDIKDLESPDLRVRRTARLQAYQVATEYVRHADVSSLASWKPVLDRYLVLNKAVLNIAALLDIVVASGATLQISKDTHAIYARNFIIHGNGRVVCHSKCSFKLTTLQGVA
jgi:hypothetical protein